MTAGEEALTPDPSLDALERLRARTPARIFTDRVGSAYLTSTQLDLREAHAAARDAVEAELDLTQHLGHEFVQRWGLVEVCSQAKTKQEYLLRPDLGRKISEASRTEILAFCPRPVDLQLVIGDGLSVSAVATQVPSLLPAIADGAVACGWSIGRTILIRHCRVGILNEVGELLVPTIVVLLIGERPGLATAESLSAYMAYRPCAAHTDAHRNLISNIHARGTPPSTAAERIVQLASTMMRAGFSGTGLQIEASAQLKSARS